MPRSTRCGSISASALAAEFEGRITTAIAGGHLPEQDARVAGAGDGRRADGRPDRAAGAGRRRCRRAREAVQSATLLALRALGVVDARARGLVAQMRAAVPSDDNCQCSAHRAGTSSSGSVHHLDAALARIVGEPGSRAPRTSSASRRFRPAPGRAPFEALCPWRRRSCASSSASRARGP